MFSVALRQPLFKACFCLPTSTSHHHWTLQVLTRVDPPFRDTWKFHFRKRRPDNHFPIKRVDGEASGPFSQKGAFCLGVLSFIEYFCSGAEAAFASWISTFVLCTVKLAPRHMSQDFCSPLRLAATFHQASMKDRLVVQSVATIIPAADRSNYDTRTTRKEDSEALMHSLGVNDIPTLALSVSSGACGVGRRRFMHHTPLVKVKEHE